MTVKRIELVLESLATDGAALLALDLRPAGWTVRYRLGRECEEEYDHVDRLSLAKGDATAHALSPIVLRRWSLGYEEHPERFDLWRWRLPFGFPPTRDGLFVG